ncbi:MAG TPA: sugar transferase [Candidatus Paceibacterota bacterium]|nr:sugar transferase [Candidatus Paceibacterota bacterium]
MKKSELFFNVIRVPLDFAMLLVAGVVTYLFRTQIISAFRPVLFTVELPLLNYFFLVVGVSCVFIGAYAISGLYLIRPRSSMIDEFLKIVIGSSAGIMTVIVFIFLQQALFNSRFLVLGGWFFAIVCVWLGRLALRRIERSLISRHGFGLHRVIVIGNGSIASRFAAEVAENPEGGYKVAGQLQKHDMAELERMFEHERFDEVILADPSYDQAQTAELVDFCNDHHCTFRFVPHLYETVSMSSSVEIVGGLPIIELRRTPLDGWGRVFKRIVDVIFAVAGLIILSPIFLVVALIIKLDSRGPVFVSLRRISKNREFDLYKFRSMVDGAHELNSQLRRVRNDRPEAGPLWKLKDDPRVTRIGRFIRRTRLDELPQFLNVIKGDMSLVGPRPHQPDEIAQYAKHHKKLLAIKAGATGMAQISGSSDLPFEKEVALDTFYIEHWSLLLDLKIIAKTAFKMLTDKSAV